MEMSALSKLAESRTSFVPTVNGMELLRRHFPEGEANDLNVVLFSTSGVHGLYTTIEEIEASLLKYGDEPGSHADEQHDFHGNQVTFLVLQPRTCWVFYGNATVSLADIPFLKRLRASSHAELAKIGMPWPVTAP